MIERQGNLWDIWESGEWICITTNGTIKKNGECVMGRGIAYEAKKKFNDLPKLIGEALKRGNFPTIFFEKRLITFPVKNDWWEKADINLIKLSAKTIKEISYRFSFLKTRKIFMPRPGCGNGKLDWKEVKPILEEIFDNDRFVVMSY